MSRTGALVRRFVRRSRDLSLFVFALATPLATVVAQRDVRAAAMLSWPTVTRDARPWTRWWWMGSAVDELTLVHALDVQFGTLTIVVGHATFCVVVVYNNVVARLRRTSASIEEASMDLGADTWQTFRYVTFPVIRTALLAGGMLAFALSFDEIIVTQFTAGTQETIPIWILNHLHQPNQRSIVNVVALFLILLSTLPVYLANRLTTDTSSGAAGRL